jgi:hypothetical protein
MLDGVDGTHVWQYKHVTEEIAPRKGEKEEGSGLAPVVSHTC